MTHFSSVQFNNWDLQEAFKKLGDEVSHEVNSVSHASFSNGQGAIKLRFELLTAQHHCLNVFNRTTGGKLDSASCKVEKNLQLFEKTINYFLPGADSRKPEPRLEKINNRFNKYLNQVED